MSKMKLKYIALTILLGVFHQSIHSQTLNDAREWYLEGRYAEALPVFRAEYQENQKDAPLNQWLGVSLFKTGRLIEAEKFLKYASEKKIPEAYLSLGELYVNLYRFDEAEKEFEKYQRANKRNNEALDRLDKVRDYSNRFQRAVSRTEDVQIIDSLVISKAEFLSGYNLSRSSGSVALSGNFFNETIISDKTLYMNERENKIYYSKGNPESLYTMEKLIDTFGNEKRLPELINDSGNQAFPFVMSDGITIYFASTGHQSYGGYDLFITRYNLNNDSYLTPNQLNMPFNSPFNDYLMVIDEEKGVGWFASDRYQPEDKVCIYTFIPNERVTLIEDENIDYLAKRAMISSISDTWKENANYSDLLTIANRLEISEEKNIKDFEFVINDSITYNTLSDFKNSSARSIFSQAIGLEKQLEILLRDLNEKRDQYANEGSNNNILNASIINLEKQIEPLIREIDRFKIQARNQEIRNNF